MADNIYDIYQIGEGFHLNTIPRILEEEQWYKWYNNDFDTLFPVPNDQNGMQFIRSKADIIKIPLPQMASDFYMNAAISSEPVMTSSNKSIETAYDEMREYFLRVIRRGVRDWTITDRAIYIAFIDGTMQAVKDCNYIRVGELYDQDETVGHVFVYPYFDYRDAPHESNLPGFIRIPNRIRIVRYQNEYTDRDGLVHPKVNTAQDFLFDGFVVGQPYNEERDAGIAAVATAGAGESFYRGTKELVAQIMIRTTNNSIVLYEHDNQIRLIPQALSGGQRKGMIVSPLDAVGDAVDRARTEAVKEDATKSIRPTMMVPEGVQYEVGTIGPEVVYTDEEAFVLYLLRQYWMNAGIPPAAFGIDVGRGESGLARAATEHNAKARVQMFRSELERAMRTLLRAVSKHPNGEIHFAWLYAPFDDITTVAPLAIELHKAGLKSVDEARAMIGDGPMPMEEVEADVERTQMRSEAMNNGNDDNRQEDNNNGRN